MLIPRRLRDACRADPGRAEWLRRLPRLVDDLVDRWRLSVAPPFDTAEGSCAWVAPAMRTDGTPAVLKLGMPHMEGEQEIAGLRFWNGHPTVRLLDASDDVGAMLLERCEPGTSMRALPEAEQDEVIARLLRRLWRPAPPTPAFRPLSALVTYWRDETQRDAAAWPDRELVRTGLQVMEQLAQTTNIQVLLATDLHAGNILRARREPWLVIDPKPFAGDPAYDATQHLLNCRSRLRAAGRATIHRFADLLEVDHDRVRLWTFARLASDPRADWTGDSMELARALAP